MDIEVRSSSIHSRGVYALRAFSAGEVVLAWDMSVTLARGDEDSLPEDERVYLHPLDSKTWLIVQPPERFVNHSCAHNTEVVGFRDVAIRDIAVGEEITSNYETDGAGLSFVCACGSPGCRGRIGVPPAG